MPALKPNYLYIYLIIQLREVNFIFVLDTLPNYRPWKTIKSVYPYALLNHFASHLCIATIQSVPMDMNPWLSLAPYACQ